MKYCRILVVILENNQIRRFIIADDESGVDDILEALLFTQLYIQRVHAGLGLPERRVPILRPEGAYET